MKRSLVPILAVVTALAIGACRWQVPEQVVVKATPEVWIPTGPLFDYELDFAEEMIDDIIDALRGGVGADLVVGEKGDLQDPAGQPYDGKPLTLFAELKILTPDIPVPDPGAGFDVLLADTTDPIDLSELFGPIPDGAQLKEVPGWVWFELKEGDTGPPPPIEVRLRAVWTGALSPLDLVHDDGDFVPLESSRETANDFNLQVAFNARPQDLELQYEFGASSADFDRIASVHLRFEIPFAFTALPGTLLELEDEEGGNPLVMEEDIFGRDPLFPDEELDGLLESIRGSNATILLRLVNSTGFGVRLGMINTSDPPAVKEDRANWVLDVNILPGETEQEVRIEITAAAVDQLIDGDPVEGQFVPEFLILLPEDFQLNRVWRVSITEGYLRARVKLDYQISLEDEA